MRYDGRGCFKRPLHRRGRGSSFSLPLCGVKRTALKRTPFKRKPSPLRRTTLNPVSERQRRYDREFRKASKIVHARSRGICEVWLSEDCSRRVEHVHHKKLRSQGGTNHPANLLGCCGRCHAEIHRNPALSYEAGWMTRMGA